jgi:hypothetical protein
MKEKSMRNKQGMLWKTGIVVLLLLLAAGSFVGVSSRVTPAHAESNGQAATPCKGWSTWSYIGKKPTAANVYAQAKLLVSSGLANAGYNYVLLDDCYYLNPSTTVDANGYWATNTTAFPGGLGLSTVGFFTGWPCRLVGVPEL